MCRWSLCAGHCCSSGQGPLNAIDKAGAWANCCQVSRETAISTEDKNPNGPDRACWGRGLPFARSPPDCCWREREPLRAGACATAGPSFPSAGRAAGHTSRTAALPATDGPLGIRGLQGGAGGGAVESGCPPLAHCGRKRVCGETREIVFLLKQSAVRYARRFSSSAAWHRCPPPGRCRHPSRKLRPYQTRTPIPLATAPLLPSLRF